MNLLSEIALNKNFHNIYNWVQRFLTPGNELILEVISRAKILTLTVAKKLHLDFFFSVI